jgi:hypothetical protein
VRAEREIDLKLKVGETIKKLIDCCIHVLSPSSLTNSRVHVVISYFGIERDKHEEIAPKSFTPVFVVNFCYVFPCLQ